MVGFSLLLHLLGAAAFALEPRSRRWALAAMLADHLLVAAVGMWPRSRLLGPNLTRLSPAQARARRVALSFDDGPDPRVTPAVLDLLDARGARASFFVIGERARRHAELTAEIARRGHRLENHTWSHPNSFAFFGPRRLAREIDGTQELVERLTGRRPRFFRAPAGIRSPLLDPLLAHRDLQLASWTRRGFDTVERDPRRVLRRLTRSLAAGDVLLLHDGSAARDRSGRPVVLEALPRLLETLAERGLEAVALEAE